MPPLSTLPGIPARSGASGFRSLSVVTPAAGPVVSVADLRNHLREDGAELDAVLQGFEAAAVAYLEEVTGRALVERTMRLELDAFPIATCPILLPSVPLLTATAPVVKYRDTAGAEQTLAASVYRVNGNAEPGELALRANESWPATLSERAAVWIDYHSGYGAAAAVALACPMAVAAVKLLVGHLYENREATVAAALQEVPLGVKALCGQLKVWRV